MSFFLLGLRVFGDFINVLFWLIIKDMIFWFICLEWYGSDGVRDNAYSVFIVSLNIIPVLDFMGGTLNIIKASC